jgi:hypothetical protein
VSESVAQIKGRINDKMNTESALQIHLNNGTKLQDQPLIEYSIGDRALVHLVVGRPSLVVDSKNPWQAQPCGAGPQEQKRPPSSTSAPLGIRSSKRPAEDQSAGLVAQRREPKASNGASESNEASSAHTPRRSNLAVSDRNTSPAGRSLMTAARGSSDADAGALASNGREDVRGAGRRAVDGGGCGGGEQKESFLKDKMEGMKVSESPAAGGSGFEDHGCECTVYFDDVRTLEGFIHLAKLQHLQSFG